MATSVDQTDFLKTALRLPRDMHARIQASAEERGASLNTEMLRLLERGLDPSVEIGDASLDKIESRMKRALTKK